MLAPEQTNTARPSGDPTVRTFGEYQIHSEIGRGGMGVIYKARHSALNRWVALKVMAGGEFASADFKQRFRTEAEAAAALEHPNIVPIYEVGEEDGQPYFSLKLVEGGTLGLWRQRLSESAPVRRRAIAEAVVTLARAVQYAHNRGVLHRDLKPNNVLVDSAGGLFLTDFGLARLIEKDSTLTETQAVMGTPSYMAPEQARGETRQLTTSADIYGLGAILYELIAGRPPFVGQSSIEIIRQVIEQEPIAPGRVFIASQSGNKHDETLATRDLDTICLKCLEKEPARRYASAAALADDLQRWLDHEPILARPTSTTERVRKWVRRRPAWAALIVTVFVSLLALGVGSAVFTMHVMRARTAAENANRDLSHNLFVHEWQEAEGLVAKNKTAGALMWFASALRRHPDDVTLATRLLSLLSEHSFALPRGTTITNDAPVRSVALFPDDTRVLTADGAGGVRCWSVDGARQLFTLPRKFGQAGAVVVPGNGNILVVDRNSVSVWPADGGSEPLREAPGKGFNFFDLSADGSRLALARADRGAEVWDMATLQRLSECGLGDWENPNFLRLSRDGRWLLRSQRSELRVFESATGRLLWRAKPALDPADWFYAKGDWSGDHGRIASLHSTGQKGGKFAVWDVQLENDVRLKNPESPRVLAPLRNESSGVAVSKDSSRASVWTRSGYVDFYSTETGETVMEPLEHAAAVAAVAEAASGKWMATASDRTVQFWDLAMRLHTPMLFTNSTPVADARFGPDGTWLAIAAADGVRIVGIADGQPRHVLPADGPVRNVSVSTDGRRVAASFISAGVTVWDTETGAVVSRMQPPFIINQLEFSPDGRRYSAAVSERDVVLLCEVETGRAVTQPMTHGTGVIGTGFSPDGKRLAVSTDKKIVLWNLPEGPAAEDARELPKAVRRNETLRHDGIVWSAQFSDDGKLLLSASSDHTARLWEVESGLMLREFRHPKPVYMARFGPGARQVLTGGADQTARLWNVADGRPMGEPMAHPGAVWYGDFSDDGQFVLTGDDEGHARVWDGHSALPLNDWVKHGTSFKRLRPSPDGRRVLSVAGDQPSVRLWRPLLAPGPAPAWLPDLAEAVAGARQLDNRILAPVPPEKLAELRSRLGASSNTDFYSRWARWFLVGRMQPNPPASPAL